MGLARLCEEGGGLLEEGLDLCLRVHEGEQFGLAGRGDGRVGEVEPNANVKQFPAKACELVVDLEGRVAIEQPQLEVSEKGKDLAHGHEDLAASVVD